MAELGSTIAPSFDPAKAVFYGQLVNAAYAMYDNHTSDPTPPWPKPLPGNYRFIAWVQMRDFIFESGNWTFYGLIAQNPSDANDHVLAIRGTSDLTEWWDDLTSMVPWPMEGFGGDVGYGFYRIYQTMRIIYPLKGLAPGGQGESLEAAGTFADQVAEAVRRHAAESQPAQPAAALKSVTVAAHSLGSALATLYVADNSRTKKVKTPLLCTYASPRVGDYTFATTFDGLGIPSWRIVNELDIVPKLPIFPFWHIQTEQLYNSGSSTWWSLECWHSIDTYLNLLDPKQPLLPACLPPKVAVATPLRVAAPAEKEIAIAAPAGTTINITIKVG
ncbi:MAG TPA: lipase family protein [Xanthobacteraceae bacterium]|nr:lipase family protein [Xanthobacteraceae bacterium]